MTTRLVTTWILIVLGVVPSNVLADSAKLHALESGTAFASVRSEFGEPEIRSVRLIAGKSVEDLYYRVGAIQLMRLTFIDGILDAKEITIADTVAPRSAKLVSHELQRRGRICVIRVGWTTEQTTAWLKADNVVESNEMSRRVAGWPGGDMWVYRVGPYVTVLRVRDGKVVELTDRRNEPDEPPATVAVADVPPEEAAPALKSEPSRARKFWKGVGTVLAIAAAGYLLHEALDGAVPPAVGEVFVIDPGSTNDVIKSRIRGEFTGWTGETVFVLQNGQVWRQANYAYHYHYAYSPRVTIVRKSGNRYELIVDGVRSTIEVERIQ